MAIALTALQRIASAIEATPGTAVAPTRLVPHMLGTSFTEEVERTRLDEARGVLAYVDDQVVRRGAMLELQQEFDWDLGLLAFLCGLEEVSGAGTGTPPNVTAPYVYTMEADPTAPTDKAAATWEVLQSDGSTDHILRQFSHARPTQIALEWGASTTTKLNTTWMGAAPVATTRTAIAASTLASRRVVPVAGWTVEIDDTWAALGTNAAANVRGLSWSFATGLTPSYHLTGRTNFDLDGWYQGRLDGSLTLTFDVDAAAAAEIAHWRAGDLRFVRLEASNGLTGANLRDVQIDQALRIITSPNLLANDGEQATVALEGQLRSDAAGAADDYLQVVMSTGLDAW